MKLKIKEYGIVMATNILCSGLMFIYNIFMRRSITPYEMGIYTSINLIITYFGYAQLGALNAYNRDYPQMLGAQTKSENADHLKNSVFTYLVFVYGVFTIFLVIIGIAYSTSNKLMSYGLMFSGLLALTNSLNTYFDFTLKSEKMFVKSSFIYFIKTVVFLISGLLLIEKYGYIGIYIAMIFSAASMLLLNIPTITRIRFSIDIQLIKFMIKSGIMLLTNSLVWTFMQSIDRFVILKFLDMEQLGIYSVALLGFSTMVLIPQSLSQVFYVKMSRLYGKTQDKKDLLRLATKYTSVIGLVTSFAAVIAYFLLPLLIRIVMPMYEDCVKSTQIIMLGVAIYGTTMLYGNVLSVLKKNKKLMNTTLFLCLTTLILTSTFVLTLGKNIESVAMGTSISYVIYALCLLGVTLHEIGGNFWNAFRGTLLPVLFVNFTIIILDMMTILDLYKLILGILIVLMEMILFNASLIKQKYAELRWLK